MSNDTILVVDDDYLVADFLVRILLPRLGYPTLTAHDGQSAIELVRTKEIALMLLDLELPDMNGMEVLRKLVADGFRVPTIMITGHGSEKVAVEAFRLGVQDYLSKPLDTSELVDALNRGLTQTRLKREKEKLTNELAKQVTWLTALAEVGKSVTSSLDGDEVLRRIVAAGVELTRAQEGFLALLDEPGGKLYLRAVKNIDEKKAKTMRLLVDDNLVGSVIRTGTPLRTSQEDEDQPLKVSTGYLVHSLLHVPMVAKGYVIGVLSVDNHTVKRSFSDEDEARLLSLADYAAVAIENSRLYELARGEIEERQKAEDALRESEERYVLAVEGANDGLWDWDLRSNRIFYSSRWKEILGLVDSEVSDSPDEWYNRVNPEEVERLKLDLSAHMAGLTPHFENEHRIMHRDGAYRWVLSRGLAVREKDGLAYRMAGSLTDITDRKNAEQRLLYDAFHDGLTGLPNRELFLDRLGLAVERSKRRSDYQYAVLFLDLDRFKNINDSLGHLMGDQLLITVGQMLQKGLRTTDTVSRLGGDEFVLLLEEIKDIKSATRVADWVAERFKSAIQLMENEVFITTSIGIVYSGMGYSRAEDVLRDADIAMYSAKARGRARYELFEPEMRLKITERLTLETELRLAVERKEFTIHYQPIISLETGHVTGFEALVRWNHPTRGLLHPADFLSVAEDSGLITPIDRWILREACLQMKQWQEEFPVDPPLTVSVNLSGKQITKPDLGDYIQEVLADTGLEASALKLEITENAIMENNRSTNDMFDQLQSMGVQIQIDDFGIGYSSLGYLSQFPVNALKIDQSFVNNMVSNNSQLKIVQSIVMLTQRLDVIVIAEGVETEEQLEQLRSLGCGYGQGYYVARPMAHEKVDELLDNLIKTGGTYPLCL